MDWDLIEHFKIDVKFCDDHILHVEYVSDLVRGLHKVSEVGQPAQCKWRLLVGQCEITSYVTSAWSSLSISSFS
jgi:hypothetical protein